MSNAVFLALADAARSGEPVALGLITGAKGSSPQKVGAKALFYGDGRIRGTLGGGCLEAEVQQRALSALRTGQAAAFDLVLDHDFGWDDGLICGGKVTGVILPNAQNSGAEFWDKLARRETTLRWGIEKNFAIAGSPVEASAIAAPGGEWLYREIITPRCALWIAGAGHISQAVAPLAEQLDFDVTIFDDRPALASSEFFPGGVSVESGTWDQLCAKAPPDRPSFGLIVTRGHRHDARVLSQWIRKPFLFLGMIGSARKARILRGHFLEEHIATAEEFDRVACPVGIPIHSQTVPEIAVSIVAQYVEKRARLVYQARERPAAGCPAED
jgi:xanthine dehydrogenase accessory factor